MSETVFILGAGASYEGGAPLMANFLDIADDIHGRLEKDHIHKTHLESAFEAIGLLQASHSKSQLDLINIESVFNALEMADILNRENILGKNRTAIESLKHLIAITLETTLQFPFQPRTPATRQGKLTHQTVPPQPYGAFASLVNQLSQQSSSAIITFNYDLAVDFALSQAGIPHSYCLGRPNPNETPLLKLHGSLNWGVCSDCNKIAPWGINEFLKAHPFATEPRAQRLKLWSHLSEHRHCDIPVKPLPFIVPPSWNKTDGHHVIQPVWQRAADELSDAQNVIIIGYSLPETDSFFRMLYALGTIGPRPLRRLWIINPDTSGETQRKFTALAGPGAAARFKYIPQRFSQTLKLLRDELVVR